jgi:hypothetical protein
MQDKFPTMNSCAFILECTKGRGRLTGAFPEQTITTCSYCRELIGLLAIHLLLLSISRVAPELTGSVHIYSDCLGALDKVKNLPPHHIPSRMQTLGCAQKHHGTLQWSILHKTLLTRLGTSGRQNNI